MSSLLFRSTARLLTPAGQRARLTILIYHRVLPARDALLPDILDAEAFAAQLELIRDCFQVMPLAQAVEELRHGNLPARSACLTFDDGYADNLTVALPILQRFRMHATFFVATDYLDGGRMFNDTVIEAVRHAPSGQYDLRDLNLGCYQFQSLQDRIGAIRDILPEVKYLPFLVRNQYVADIAKRLGGASLPDHLMLSTEQLRTLHDAGMEIGAHTASHPILARLSDAEAKDDILRGKEHLERLLSTKIRLFAYPNGRPGTDYLAVHIQMLRELGFIGAVSTASGVATRGTDPFQLPRFSPWSRNRTRTAHLLLRNLVQRHPVPALLGEPR